MKINIFGVGRSGTKAVQLYLSYLLAKKYGSVWLNYEPFLYQNRKLKKACIRGKEIHRQMPLLLEENSLDSSLVSKTKKFGNDLVSQNEVVVSKFIRGNGRINLINQYTNPDFSLFIIRDIYEVLRSSIKANWCMVDKHDWERFLKEAKTIYPAIENRSYFSDKLYVVATYWYVMNKFALENAKKLFVIKYTNLDGLYGVECFGYNKLLKSNLKISSPRFEGSKIHTDFTIKDHKTTENTKNSQFLNKVKTKLFKDNSNQLMGNLVTINQSPNIQEKPNISKYKNKINVEIYKNDFLEKISTEIDDLISERSKKVE